MEEIVPLVRDEVLPLVREAVRPLVRDEVLPLVEETVLPLVREAVRPLVRDEILPLVEETVLPLVREAVRPLVRDEVLPRVKEKMLQELGPGHSTPTSVPSRQAPGFHPAGMAGGGEVPRTTPSLQKPGTYDGRSSWDAYKMQFEMLARVNRWRTEEKATYLAVSLRGPALAVLSNVPEASLYDYEALVAALEARFGDAHQAELHRMRLKNRSRQHKEGLPELVEDIERLTRLAHPDAQPSMLELLARDQFIEALPEEETRLRLRQSRSGSLREALKVALELESYQLASQQRQTTVRATRTDSPQRDSEPPATTGQRPPWVDELLRCIKLPVTGNSQRAVV